MKKLLLIILIYVSGITLIYSQASILEKSVNIKVKNKSVTFVLEQISRQSGYFFTYNPNVISQNKKLTFSSQNKTIKDVLDFVLADTSLYYKIIEDHIVICKNKDSLLFYSLQKNEDDNFINISGKITDKKTKRPLAFVSVGILNSTIGTVSNENGIYSLKINKRYQDSTFFVAHIGYKTYLTPISKTEQSNYNISLLENFVSIQEIIIRTNDPIDILKQVLKNKQQNYIQKPGVLTAFYREGVEKKEHILNFSEAIINIYKTPYKPTLSSDKIKVVKSRKIINTEIIDSLNVKLKNGLYSGLELDIIKSSIDFLEENNMPYYKYQTTDIVTFGDKLAYVIEFVQKENVQNTLYKGRILVETESYAVISADFELNLKAGNQKVDFVVKKNQKLNVSPISAKYHINYRITGNKYMLNHVRADVELKIKHKREMFYTKYNTFFETVVFDIDTVNPEKFDRRKTVKKNITFIDSNYNYDPLFWGTSNFIKPEKSIKDALNQIKVKLNYLK